MAKKKEVIEAVEAPVTQVIETSQKAKPVQNKNEWAIKDRTYILKGSYTPLTATLPSRHSGRFPLLWFDEKTGEQKELRYATNQN